MRRGAKMLAGAGSGLGLGLGLALGLALVAQAGRPPGAEAAVRRPVVAELFTSEGCSSCPPADAVLTDLARTRPDVLALAFHVTYWDRLGWPDPYAFAAATDRQRAYAAALGLESIYTPQMVVDGTRDVVGSDREGVATALADAARADAAVPLRLTRSGGALHVAVGAGQGGGRLLLVGYDAQHRTAVGRGENAGQVLVESNVVRDLRPLGAWDGTARSLDAPAPRGEEAAVLLQAADGRILGAARAE
jgi:hypothetical protein